MENEPLHGREQSQFKPGQSGNPAGRPVGHITKFLREFGESIDLQFTIERTDATGAKTKASSHLSTSQQTINQAIAARLLQMALNGDIKAIKEVLNRTEGRVPQPINLGGQDGNPLQVLLTGGGGGRMGIPPAETETQPLGGPTE